MLAQRKVSVSHRKVSKGHEDHVNNEHNFENVRWPQNEDILNIEAPTEVLKNDMAFEFLMKMK